MFVLLASKFSPFFSMCIIFGICVAIAILYDPRIGFLITAAVVPLERFGRFTDDTSSFTLSLMRVLGLITLAGLTLHVLTQKEKFQSDKTLTLYGLYTALCLVSIFYSTDFNGSIRAFGQILSNIAFFFLVINIVKDFQLAKRGIILWLVVTVLIGVYTAYDWHFGNFAVGAEEAIGKVQDRFATVWIDYTEWESGLGGIKRAMGSTSHAAVYGINLILTLPFFIFFLKKESNPFIKTAIFLAFMVVCYNLFLTNTRAVLLVAIITLIICMIRGLLTLHPKVVLAIFLAGMVGLWFINFSVFQRIFNPKNYTFSKSRTLRIRMAYWDAGSRVFLENWLLGIGIGNKNEIPKYVKGRVPARTTVHNEYLQTLMEIGVSGYALFFSFVGMLLYYSFKTGKRLELYDPESEEFWFMVACQISITVSLIYALQCDMFHFPLKGWWMIAGIIVVMKKIFQQRETTPVNSHSL